MHPPGRAMDALCPVESLVSADLTVAMTASGGHTKSPMSTTAATLTAASAPVESDAGETSSSSVPAAGYASWASAAPRGVICFEVVMSPSWALGGLLASGCVPRQVPSPHADTMATGGAFEIGSLESKCAPRAWSWRCAVAYGCWRTGAAGGGSRSRADAPGSRQASTVRKHRCR